MTKTTSYALQANFDSKKSFYGKASVFQVERDNGTTETTLRSYGTKVAMVEKSADGETKAVVYDTYSATTLRHIKEFLFQHNFPAMSKGQIQKYLMNDENELVDCKELIDTLLKK